MSAAQLAEFTSAAAIAEAARAIDGAGFRLCDALTPYPVPAVSERIKDRPSRIRPAMLIAGLVTAAFAFGLQWYSAVHAYPINSGGRPLNSWPVFLLVPFEVSVLAAAVAGFATLLFECGLPRLHHPTFAAVGFERASQDRYFLLTEAPSGDIAGLRAALYRAGAVTVSELDG